MKAPVSRCRRSRPTLPTRTMDLLGVGDDGNLYVWSAGAEVQPLDRFPLHENGNIVSGHYVIDRDGKAITAHIGQSVSAKWVVVQYMCGGLPTATVPRKYVEPDLLGRYVPDPKHTAEIVATLQRMTADVEARQTAPHRKRGRA